ncbi:hypothetical protein EV426DRAFT_720458 [Tirmania nivea]|nr:hypothetical protein EV426DRAFT_720458 [Tirmania nivea]
MADSGTVQLESFPAFNAERPDVIMDLREPCSKPWAVGGRRPATFTRRQTARKRSAVAWRLEWETGLPETDNNTEASGRPAREGCLPMEVDGRPVFGRHAAGGVESGDTTSGSRRPQVAVCLWWRPWRLTPGRQTKFFADVTTYSSVSWVNVTMSPVSRRQYVDFSQIVQQLNEHHLQLSGDIAKIAQLLGMAGKLNSIGCFTVTPESEAQHVVRVVKRWFLMPKITNWL